VNCFYCIALSIVIAAQAAAPFQQSSTPEHARNTPWTKAEISQLQVKAEAGELGAQTSLAKAYQEGDGVQPSEELAFKWYRKAAEQGVAAAQNRVGLMYSLGRGTERNKEQAVAWFHKAARAKNAKAMFNLGAAYYNGDGAPSDPNRAYAWFLLAQEEGDPPADDAVKRSAEEGKRFGATTEALKLVAAMYEKGEDLPQSDTDAAKWYRKAVDVGDSQAAVKLAAMFIDGRGVPRDYGQALTLCEGAAKQNYAPGQYCVGYIHLHGLGTQVDPKEAAKWYDLASKGGQTKATMDLAEMYWKGEGVDVNRPEAYYLFFLARRAAPDAKTRGQTLWQEMSRDEIKHLQKKLRDLRLDPQKVFASMQEPSPSEAPEGPVHP
jgi:TPR repeat protein